MSGNIQLTGSIPGLINENTPLWDWSGQLRLTTNPSQIRYVEVAGRGENYFDATLNRSTGMIEIRPLAQLDYEWFIANGQSTNITFTIRFYMADGTIATSSATYSVTVLNIDDTPPQSLSFASGGIVAAGAQGALIGRLAVTDPDTTSGFTFTIREDEQWMFEVVNGDLRLRSGVSLALADGPYRPLVITVSDGHQSQAFTIMIGVTVPAIGNGQVVDLLETHEKGSGFQWASQKNLISLNMSYDIASLRDFGSLIHIIMRDGSAITIEQPDVIDLLDGYITFSGSSWAARVWTIYESILNREARHGEMYSAVNFLAGGGASETLVAQLFNSAEFRNSYGQLSNAGFVERLYLNIVGWVDNNGVNWHGGRLDQGRSRESVAMDLINWRMNTLNHDDARAGNGGFFVPRSWAMNIDSISPLGMGVDAATFAHWWASQIISGRVDVFSLGEEFDRVQGLLPRIEGLSNRSAIERFFTEMTGAPPESTWAASLAQLIEKNGQTATEYLRDILREVDLQEAYQNQSPQGIAFQAGW